MVSPKRLISVIGFDDDKAVFIKDFVFNTICADENRGGRPYVAVAQSTHASGPNAARFIEVA